MTWYLKQPELLKDIENTLAESEQDLALNLVDGDYQIDGNWKVNKNNLVLEEYQVQIDFPDNYPDSLPLVYETSKKIPRCKDRHLNPPNWHACLFLNVLRPTIWPKGTSFSVFLNHAVDDFFFSQAYFEEYKKWPWGDYSHGVAGIVELLKKTLKTTSLHEIRKMVELATWPSIPRQNRCPCGSKKRTVKCHGKHIGHLKSLADVHEVKRRYEELVHMASEQKIKI